MIEFKKNNNKEKALVKIVKKNHKKWQIGRWVLLAVVLLIAFLIYKAVTESMGELDGTVMGGVTMALWIVARILIPVIALFIIYAFAIGGGRDILLARSNEKLFLNSTCLKNTFTPKVKQTFNADEVEYNIEYDHIREMYWNKKLCRLEILANYTCILVSNKKVSEKDVSNKTFIIYDCFDNIEQLLDELEKRTGVEIIGRNRQK